MTSGSLAPHEKTSTHGFQRTALVAVAFWSCAFVINEGIASLRGELSFELAGGHRVAAFCFGAFLAFATANILKRLGSSTRNQSVLATATIIAMPVLHAIFFFFTCKVAPIDGVAPMTVVQAAEKALLSTGYFAAWVALQLAMIYSQEARKSGFSPQRRQITPAGTCEPARVFWASWRNQRVGVRADDIHWVEAQKDYAILHCADRSCIMRTTLTSLAAELAGEQFVRIHRSVIVHRTVIGSLRRKPTGALVLKTKCGAELPVGRRFASALRERPRTEQRRFAGRSSQICDSRRATQELPLQGL